MAVRDPGAQEGARAIRRLGRKLVREAPGNVGICYEAGSSSCYYQSTGGGLRSTETRSARCCGWSSRHS